MIGISQDEMVGALSRVKTSFFSSCEDYIKGELCCDKLCSNTTLRIIIPFILVVLLLAIIKPSWIIDDTEQEKINYIKLVIFSFIIYLIIIVGFMFVRGFFHN